MNMKTRLTAKKIEPEIARGRGHGEPSIPDNAETLHQDEVSRACGRR